jgi:hypothetical protein
LHFLAWSYPLAGAKATKIQGGFRETCDRSAQKVLHPKLAAEHHARRRNRASRVRNSALILAEDPLPKNKRHPAARMAFLIAVKLYYSDPIRIP